MFYSRSFLARKSPLGTIWIAAHLHHKLRKSQVVVTNIPSSVDCIMFPEVPIALRLLGHLLLGVVRIYSKKVDYLHHDCNEFLSHIRTVIATIQVNLPEDASHAPFHSVTLPETFELDALNLDDAIYQAETPDNHLKTWEEITMTDQIPGEGDPYVAFFVDKDVRMDPSSEIELLNLGPDPMEEDVIPPPGNNDVGVRDPGPSNQASESSQRVYEDHVSQDLPETEVLRDAVESLGGDGGLPDLGNNIVEQHELSNPTQTRDNLTPIMEGFPVTGEESLPSQLHPMPPTNISPEEPDIFNSRASFGPALSEMALQPTPPVEMNKVETRKRKQSFDEMLVLQNEFIQKQLEDTSKLVRKRRKLPLSALDVWRSHKRLKHDNIFIEPSISGMCSDLQGVFKKNFIASEVNPVPLIAPPEQRSENDPASTPAFDMEIELPRFEGHVDVPLPDFEQSPSGREEHTPILASNLGSESQTGNPLEPEIVLTPDLRTFAEPSRLESETPTARLEEELPEGIINLRQIPEMLISADSPVTSLREQQSIGGTSNYQESKELSFLDTEVTPTEHERKECDSLTVRTRHMAEFLKEQSPSTEMSRGLSGHLSLNKILEGETRKRCARMFYEALVLKTYGFIDAHQDEAYGDITLSLTPSLWNANF
ncbi:hypothetical protein MRB53_006973 [Persea americana]|uniref:Uncharacterized protein n=1 Tax=Persea americana TaxID=3435 RepID=A0ACC2MHU0_PERAE|nr:hypothetical protein MRB53_006973 [Persea americana]